MYGISGIRMPNPSTSITQTMNSASNGLSLLPLMCPGGSMSGHQLLQLRAHAALRRSLRQCSNHQIRQARLVPPGLRRRTWHRTAAPGAVSAPPTAASVRAREETTGLRPQTARRRALRRASSTPKPALPSADVGRRMRSTQPGGHHRLALEMSVIHQHHGDPQPILHARMEAAVGRRCGASGGQRDPGGRGIEPTPQVQ